MCCVKNTLNRPVPLRRNDRLPKPKFSLIINHLPKTGPVIASGDVFAAVFDHRPPLAASRLLSRTEACFGTFYRFIGMIGVTLLATPASLHLPLVALNPLSFIGAVRNGDAKALDLFSAVSEAHL
jgi:hypothetical protein